MGSKKKREDYDYVKIDVIRRACRGNGDALGKVITRYHNYGRKCLREIAFQQGLNTQELPIEDLMQEVWIRMIKLIVTKFKP